MLEVRIGGSNPHASVGPHSFSPRVSRSQAETGFKDWDEQGFYTPVRFSSQALTWKLGWALQPPLKLPTFERLFSLSEMLYESRVVSGSVSVPWAPVSEAKTQWNLEGRTQSHLQVGQCLSRGISISVSVELGFICCDPAQLLSLSPLVPE